jgi:hypothetical protein
MADTRRRQEMQLVVEQRLTTLRSMSLDSIRGLPVDQEFPESSRDLEIDGLPAKIHVYHEREGEVHRIVVQGIRPSATGISALVIAKGFVFDNSESIRDLRDDELYDYT